jgi:hypothetical protein
MRYVFIWAFPEFFGHTVYFYRLALDCVVDKTQTDFLFSSERGKFLKIECVNNIG